MELENLLTNLPREAADAVVGMARLKSRDLNDHLRNRLGSTPGSTDSALSEPFLQGAFPWKLHPGGWEGLPNDLFDPRTLETLKTVAYPPYGHQVAAWRYLTAQQAASVIISSGTGSGKTECFLAPILDSLVKASDGGSRRVEGVRALMLYPLNALISSQEERLAEWFRRFGGALRYCLYNGDTPESVPRAQTRLEPWKVADRLSLRSSPPPILVTNVTMLEYMLIRQRDSPILNISQGTLDFVILDEAHSYVGAQAAEISLLLRRVALAFGRAPSEIRYVATSATIGGEDGEELRTFLRDLSGAPEESVHLVRGAKAPLPRANTLVDDPIDLVRLSCNASEELGAAFARSRPLREIRERLVDDKNTLSWSQWCEAADQIGGPRVDPTRLLVAISGAHDPYADLEMVELGVDAVLPVRLHVFHRTLMGLWACVNPHCSGRPRALGVPDWCFGAVFLEPREHCSHCGSIVLEWAFCTQCGDGALKAESASDAQSLQPWTEQYRSDEFEQTLDLDETFGVEDEDEAVSGQLLGPVHDRRYLGYGLRNSIKITFDAKTGEVVEGKGGTGLTMDASRHVEECPHCGSVPKVFDAEKGVLRSLMAGAPYLMSQITPGLVGRMSPKAETDQPLPLEGRQLITFTDARQGTARHAANIQIASERGFIRSFLYHVVQERQGRNEAEIAEFDDKIARLEAQDDKSGLEDVIQDYKRRRTLAEGSTPPKAWCEVVKRLENETTVHSFLRELWAEREESFADVARLSEFLLYREIMRRPVRANSAETLGLVRFVVPGVDEPGARVPDAAERLGLSREDWQDLVRLVLTHFVRTNVILDFDAKRWLRWIDRRHSHIEAVPWEPNRGASRYVRVWPHPYTNRPSRVVRMLLQGLNLDGTDPTVRDQVQEVMKAVWSTLNDYRVASSNGYRFQLRNLHLAAVHKAYWCPTTRRLVDTTFRSLSPYDSGGIHPPAKPVEMPTLRYVWRCDEAGQHVDEATIEAWLESDKQVLSLRAMGAWGDQQDRAVKLTRWLRAAEHSAQQPSLLLRGYEKDFKEGRINVLGCSTTMEMGVDIGDIEAVVNTNAPPAIANYRQRVGRAGRRRQPIALAVTMCKDRPLDRLAFSAPAEFLAQDVPAPKVSLESPTIGRRHAHALLLARFLSGLGAELHKLTNGRFFGLGIDAEAIGGDFPWRRFLSWIDRAMNDEGLLKDLEVILDGTPLRAGPDLFEDVRDSIEQIATGLAAEWDALLGDGVEGEGKALLKAREYQRKRLQDNYLLAELAARGFLPSYGFPTDLVAFVTATGEERRRRQEDDENRFTDRGYPSRPRDIAVFEYAPGRGIVVDGVVRESAGVTLNWKRPASESGVREVQSLRNMRSCQTCGALHSTPSAALLEICPDCGGSQFKVARFLAPGGFAVDVRYELHDDPSEIGGGPPVDPWVSARASAWRSLPDPDVGRVRNAADGVVFWFNPGPHGEGFEVCLHCGRANAETARVGPSSLLGHRPLRGGPRAEDGRTCTGSPDVSPYAVARHLRLGHEIKTDVCEVQLYDCSGQSVALTIALALREAAARRLGIDVDEMGFAAPQAVHPGGRQNWSAVVFDRASGGAGFSATIAHDPVGMLSEARDLLDCLAAGRCGDPDAVAACPRCVLSADSQHAAENTDRAAAFELLQTVAHKTGLPERFRLFGPATRYESAPLAEALSEELGRDGSAAAIVWAQGEPATWILDEWPLSRTLERWGGRGRTIWLATDAQALTRSDPVTRRSVVLWAERAKVKLTALSAHKGDNRLAAVVGSTSSVVWASSQSAANVIGAEWGTVSQAPVVKGPAGKIEIGALLNHEQLLAERQREAIVEVDQELDGPVSGFGLRLKVMLRGRSEELHRVLSVPCLKIEYSDRYLFNPLSVRLLAELIRGFGDEHTEVVVRTLGARRGLPPHPGKRLHRDWQDLRARNAVLSRLLADVAPLSRIQTEKQAPHRRRLDFSTPEGSGTIFFDQGVGSWRTFDEPFDHEASIDTQVENLRQHFVVKNNPEGTFLAVRLN